MSSHRPGSCVLWCLVLIAACDSAPPEPSEPQTIGVVTTVSGFPSVVRKSQSYIIDMQSRLYEGDIVQTDERSRVMVTMMDNTKLELGPRSHLVFHQYEFVPGDVGPTAKITLTTGSMHLFARYAAELRKGRFEVRTPLGIISVREGEFWAGFAFADNSLDVALIEGKGITLSNDHGNVEMNRPRDGSTVIGGTAPQPATPWTERKLERALEETTITHNP